jgi:hypothetical protein
MTFGALGLPQYLVELNISGTTNGWVLGVSALGTGTVLRSNPTTGANLTAVTGFIAAEINRGRDNELAQTQTGTLTVTLDNADGRFSPDNAASPYYPNIVPGRQIRLSARYNQSLPWIPLFYGYVQSYQPQDNGPADANMVVHATDWLGRAALPDLTDVRPQETDTARFAALAASIGTDSLPVAIVGPPNNTETLLAKTYSDKGLPALLQIADTARGMVYHARDGTITYRTRYGRYTAPGAFATNGWVFDQPGLNPATTVMPYTTLGYDFTFNFLYNSVAVTGGDNVRQLASDGAAQTRYGPRPLDLSLPLLPGTRSADLATFLLAGYKDPYPRVSSIGVDGDAWANLGRTPLWDTILAIEIGDTVRVVKRQPGNLGIDRTMFVEGVQHSIQAKEKHVMTLRLSDQKQAGPAPWILGQSQLGRNTYLAY